MKESVYLRALELEDLARTHKWHNDKSLYDLLAGNFNYISKECELSWLEKKCQYSTIESNLAICVTDSNSHIGNIYLGQIDWISRRAYVEIFIGEKNHQSKGFGQIAIAQVMDIAFLDYGLNKLFLEVLANNERAIHVYEKNGFIVEGRLRNHIFKNGDWCDLICMGVLKEDWIVRQHA